MRRTPFRVAIAACAIAAAGLAASLWIAPYPVAGFEDVRASWQASDAWLLDRNGRALSRVRIDHDRRRGEWVPATEVSPALSAMVVASEDRRFREHGGVDWRAIFAALKQTLAGERRGGSTLTMQLASHLHPEIEASGRRNVVHKWRQMRQALAIERRWSKAQILEAWLNLTPFRGELEGVDAASRALFGKRASGLDRIESALLAALVRAPNAAPSRVARRACLLLAANDVSGNASKAECLHAEGMAAGGLRASRGNADLDGLAPHLARKLLHAPGERLVSTLDSRLQAFAAETLERHLRELEARNVEDGALVVIDRDGDVLAWVGSSGTLSRSQQVDGVLARRQPGSTLKPFLYALAIERRLLTAASVLDDSPLAVTLPTGLYVPQNYDRSFKGAVSLRQALASSLNVPAVRSLALVGYEPFYRRLKSLGFASLTRDADHYGYSLALGGAEVTLLELTNAYRTLANGGRLGAVRTALQTTPTPDVWPKQGGNAGNLGFPLFVLRPPEVPVRNPQGESWDGGPVTRHASPVTGVVVDPRAAFIVSDILADAAARAPTFGFASPLATRYPASVKTGTSKEMRDNWAVGFAGRYTVGVWVGNFSGAPMHDVSGVDGAAPIWREVMDYLHEGATVEPRTPPPGLVHQHVAYAGGFEPGRNEWFIAGTETPLVVPLEANAAGPRIESPARGAVYAIDPDIPRERQRLIVTARGAPKGARLILDDGTNARADRPLLWFPRPGSREIILKTAAGKELDRVRFEVRGLSARPGTTPRARYASADR